MQKRKLGNSNLVGEALSPSTMDRSKVPFQRSRYKGIDIPKTCSK